MAEFKAGLTWPKFTAEYKKKHPTGTTLARSAAWEEYKEKHYIVANSFGASSTKIIPKKSTSKTNKKGTTTELYLVTWIHDDQNEELSDKDRMHVSTSLYTARPKAVKSVLNSLKDIDADYRNMTFEAFNAQIASKQVMIYEKEYNTVILERMVVNPTKLSDPIEDGIDIGSYGLS